METQALAKEPLTPAGLGSVRDLTHLAWKIEARAELGRLGEGALGSEREDCTAMVGISWEQVPVSPLPCRTSTSSASRRLWNTWAVLIIMQHKPWAPPDTSALRQVPWM